jgi:KDO2-lipid IV(A) lauroyltransferase
VTWPRGIERVVAELRRHDSLFWRRAIRSGVVHGPDAFVRYSPPLFGLAFAVALGGARRAVRRNLRLARGPRGALDESAAIARVFACYASCLTDVFAAAEGHPIESRCVHDERIAEALARGRGVIVATAHTGGWQLAGSVLRDGHGARVVVVMQRERDGRAGAVQLRAQERDGVTIHHAGADPLRSLALLEHLRRGGVVAVQADRAPSGMRAREVELFGRPFLVPEGPLRLAAASGAPIVPAFSRRVGHRRYDILVEPALVVPGRPTAAELDSAARDVARAMERFLRENPTQWFHFE